MPVSKGLANMSVAELEKRYKLKTQKGILSAEGGKYYIKVGEKKQELNLDYVITSAPLKSLVGEVRVIGRGPGIIIVESNGRVKIVRILCYIPAPEVYKPICYAAQRILLASFVKEGLFTRTFANNIRIPQADIAAPQMR
jgi:hypothetical protein